MIDRSPSRTRLAVRAVRHKLRLLTAFDALWPAAARGGRLLLRGRFREFGRKLLNEMDEVEPAPPRPAPPGPRLFLAGHLLGTGGYDHVVLAVLKGLTAAGVNLARDDRLLFRRDVLPAGLRPARGVRSDEPRLLIAPPHLLARFDPDPRTAVLTMWETDTLPAAGVRQLNRAGLVVVPSRWGAECFRANGVRVPVEVVPLGHDPEVFSITAPQVVSVGVGSPSRPVFTSPLVGEVAAERRVGGRPRHGGELIVRDGAFTPHPNPPPQGGREPDGRPASPVTFGTAGALDEGGLRKNVQRVIDLFRRAFPAEPGVRLRVKITPTSPPVDAHADPRIDVIRTPLSPGQLAGWYRSLTAYVNGSFGEGFGLHLLEAMACGRPLVSTTFGGAGAFFDADVGYAVGHRLVEANNAVYRGRWADPDDGELAAALRRVYHDPAEAARLGGRAAARAAAFTWAATVRRLLDVLARHDHIRHRT